jgi:hypothetical protein
MNLKERLLAAKCFATESADKKTCREKYGVESWCAACLMHCAAFHLKSDIEIEEVPRRADMRRWTAAERAIYDALQAVEAMPADVRLTDAVTLLGAAKDSVADFIDGVEFRRTVFIDGDLLARRIEDYRSGYSAGWSHGKNDDAMHDLRSARLFFGVRDDA